MCVIFVCEAARPAPGMLRAGFEANRAGAGFAWREKDAKGVPIVKWKKGLNMEEALKLGAELPLPFVAHFRIPTCGGASQELCHPFPVDNNVPLYLEGHIKSGVIFHNGHWGDWKKMTHQQLALAKLKLPWGAWSDSRAIAWHAANFGYGVLELIDEKVCLFTPEGPAHIFGYGWKKIEDIWCSNDNWEHTGSKTNWKNWRTVYNADGSDKPKEEDTRLPAHYQGVRETSSNGASEGEAKTPPLTAKVIDIASYDLRTPGGVRAESPFARIRRAFDEGRLSRKQFKKARKAYEKDLKSVWEIEIALGLQPGLASPTLIH